jgi:hypothetical protein
LTCYHNILNWRHLCQPALIISKIKLFFSHVLLLVKIPDKRLTFSVKVKNAFFYFIA